MAQNDASHTAVDWAAWHAEYDSDTPLRRRLEIVQRFIRTTLTNEQKSPIRVISLCAGEARDLLGALDLVSRRDICGRLVELDPALAAVARRGAVARGLNDLEVITGDAGRARAYVGATPAELVLACGVFGNISDEDIQRTVRALPQLCAPGATVIWTRHREPPDITPLIRSSLADAGFEEIAFEPVPDGPGSVGVARYAGEPQPLVEGQLFTFIKSGPSGQRPG